MSWFNKPSKTEQQVITVEIGDKLAASEGGRVWEVYTFGHNPYWGVPQEWAGYEGETLWVYLVRLDGNPLIYDGVARAEWVPAAWVTEAIWDGQLDLQINVW